MAVTQQTRPKRKPTGARYVDYRKRRKYEMGAVATLTKIGKAKRKSVRKIGGGSKVRALSVENANVYDSKSKKYVKSKIKNVAENPANRHFIRRNIVTKGAVVETEAGRARVTSSPGRDGTVNAVLV